MNLFNSYENKTVKFVLDYLTYCPSNVMYTVQEAEEILTGNARHPQTPNNIIQTVLNKDFKNKKGGKHEKVQNLFLMYEDKSGNLAPLMKWKSPFPERTSLAERAWLSMMLKDNKSDLFIRPETKRRLKKLISGYCTEIPDISGYFDTRSLPGNEPWVPDNRYIDCFRKIADAILHSNSLHIEAKNENTALKLYPYMLDYDDYTNGFTLIGLDLEKSDPVFIPLDNVSFTEVIRRDPGTDYNELFSRSLEKHMVHEPVIINIDNNPDDDCMAIDRAGYLFSAYDTECSECNGIVTMKIYYYDFQRDDVIRNILSLGKYVTVTGPEEIRSEIVENLRALST